MLVLFGHVGLLIEVCERCIHLPRFIVPYDVFADDNDLTGTMPTEIGLLTSLGRLGLGK